MTEIKKEVLAETSIDGPAFSSLSHYWTWTGTDPHRSLNIAYTSTLPSWPAPVVTLHEAGFGPPQLGYSTKLGLGAPNTVTILLAWTGIDVSHHLNVAVIQIG